MRFTWRALVLAPVFVPLLYCALLAVAVDGRPLPIGSFLVLFVPAAVFSYGVTIFLISVPAVWRQDHPHRSVSACAPATVKCLTEG
jgi:hypothetical protein